MGFLDGLLGNATEVSAEGVAKEYSQLFIPGEVVEAAYKLVRDVYIFTDRRLILIDKQGITGRKVEYLSIPYKSISRFSVETAGHFDLDAELKIWISSATEPTIEKNFTADANIYAVQQRLAEHTCR